MATAVWKRLISLPLFPAMRREEQDAVIVAIRSLAKHGRVRRRLRRAA
jgi:dTDP-4-amino-4,6-dideoxygalactose transaminase